jgi:glyoxylase-like metal-dependent hydrolase (beta-lactamase superfamily II)
VEIGIRRLTTGVARQRRASRGALRYVVDDWEDDAVPVNAYLVEHPAARCLFDAGQVAAASKPGYLPRWHPFLRLARFELERDDEVDAQLELAGVSPNSIDVVVLSHLHTAHVGAVGAFANARVVVEEAEWRRARGLLGRVRGYTPGRWPRRVSVTRVALDGPAVGPFPRSYDVLGDGRLSLVPTPGHTPGHASLVVLDESRTWFLAGDLVHHPAELDEGFPAIAAWCREHDVTVLTAHDEAAGRGGTQC